jgi:hypothetical protein
MVDELTGAYQNTRELRQARQPALGGGTSIINAERVAVLARPADRGRRSAVIDANGDEAEFAGAIDQHEHSLAPGFASLVHFARDVAGVLDLFLGDLDDHVAGLHILFAGCPWRPK